MDEIWKDFEKAVKDAEKRGAVLKPQRSVSTELDRAVERYKTEQEEYRRKARLFG